MVKGKKVPYGYIYKVTNTTNGKVYIGKTGKTIGKRWSRHIAKAEVLKRAREANPHEKISGTHLNNAINKYGTDAFRVNQEDIAYSKEELNELERYYVKEYDSMNPDKGYNMTEGGEGGRLSPEVIDKLREIAEEKAKDPVWRENVSKGVSEKYQKDPKYYDKQVNERRERAKDPEWVQKMTEINQEIARNPETQEKLSESISEKWQDQQYQESVSKGVTGKWQESEYRDRQFKARTEGKRDIPDKREFLKDIQQMKKADLNKKHDMNGKCINKRIEEMLGHHGVKNFSQAKKYLENKNLDKVVKGINKRLDNQPEKLEGRKKEISNKREFLNDIQNMKSKEIEQKYGMNMTTVQKRIIEMLGDQGVKNLTEARSYLKDKNLDKVIKEINEKLNNEPQKSEGTTIISNKREFLEDIQKLQKSEIDYKYKMDAKTVNNKIEEILGENGVKNYTEAKEYLKDKKVEDVLKEMEEREAKKQKEDENEEYTSKEKDNVNLNEKEDVEGKTEESKTDVQDSEKEGEVEKIVGKQEEEKVEPSSEKGINDAAEQDSEPKQSEVEDVNRNSGIRLNSSEEEKIDHPYFTRCYGSEPPFVESKRDDSKLDDSGKGSLKDYEGISQSPIEEKSENLEFDGFEEASTKDYEGISEDRSTSDLEASQEGRRKDYDGIDEPIKEEVKDYERGEEGYGDGGGGW